MFNNPYQMEQTGRMHQQELLQAQLAHDLARAALAVPGTDQPRRSRTLRTLVERLRHSFARVRLIRHMRTAWLSWLFLLVGLLVVVAAPSSAAAAEHSGGTGSPSARIAPDATYSGGVVARIDPGTDISLSMQHDPGLPGGTHGVVDAGIPAAGPHAVVDGASDGGRSGVEAPLVPGSAAAATVSSASTTGFSSTALLIAALGLVLALNLLRAQRRRQPRSAA